ncbi:MAG: PEP-CTERM sorting domain-containing protein [Terracidiphilus sp.]
MNSLGVRHCAKFALVASLFVAPASALLADDIVVTYAAAGVQAPDTTILCGSDLQCWVGEQTFAADSVPTAGVFPTIASIGGLTGEISGTYSGTGMDMYAADQYGGAGGTGYYPELFAAGGSYTLTLTTSGDLPGVNYFGLWFSALDAGNELQFYENDSLLLTFTPAMFESLVGACPGSTNAFCGNPNANFLNDDSGEQYAFLNFFDQNGYFNKIVFTESGGGGFESDNHTVAYMDPPTPSGTVISGEAPEPSSLVLLLTGIMILMGISRRLTVGRTS